MQIGVESSRAVDNKRLFVVDDDEIIRAALQFMLHDENETHEVPGRGQRAPQERTDEARPDPARCGTGAERGRGGGEQAEKPHHRHETAAGGGQRQRPLIDECRQNGADAVLVKPITIEATRKQVDRLLGRVTRMVIPIHGL